MHAFDCAFGCAFHKSHSNANAYTILWRHLNEYSNVQHSNAHSNAFAFVNKPAWLNFAKQVQLSWLNVVIKKVQIPRVNVDKQLQIL